jgi:DNA-binding NtrC family response regulator
MANLKVLIVDDEIEFSQALAERMEMRGVKVEIAQSGMEAIEKVEKETYDAIILDLVMPGMDGIETLKKIKNKRDEMQVILLTGQGTIEKGVESVKLGAVDFLEKPAHLNELMEKINRAKGNRLVIVEKKQEEQIKEIISKKAW